jgi:hypothetical protein
MARNPGKGTILKQLEEEVAVESQRVITILRTINEQRVAPELKAPLEDLAAAERRLRRALGET